MAGRTSRIEIRVSNGERAAMAACSRRAGKTVSAYLRDLATRDPSAPTLDIDAAGLRRAYADLKRAGSNVNQIARSLNTYGPRAAQSYGIEDALSSLATAADAVATALATVRSR